MYFQVFYLDFGNTEWLSVRDIHEIQPQFLHLPFQAIECFLHNVEPVGDGETWSKEAKYVNSGLCIIKQPRISNRGNRDNSEIIFSYF